MKHKLIVLASAAIIVGLSLICVNAYNHNQHALKLRAQASAAFQRRIENHKRATEAAELNKLKSQCAQDHAAYNALPVAQKSKSTAPDCNPNLQLVQ